jgi:cytochrome c553
MNIRRLLSGMALGAGLTSLAVAAAPPETWRWAFPPGVPALPAHPDAVKALHIPGSSLSFTEAQTHDLSRAVDWFPKEHPAMPAAVAAGHGGANACGFCHMPNGEGRPENAALAGLSADYIQRQVAAFADGSRHAVLPGPAAVSMMTATAKAAASADISAAAAYYSRLRFVSQVRVVEARDIPPATPYRFAYALGPDPKQPLGQRIVEAPDDADRFERRDPHVRFIAYVPVGAIAAGEALAATGGPAGTPCASCHGVGLSGGMAPPLAGRSPTGIVRQLMGFKAGTRADPEGAPMRSIAGQLDDGQMIALAAYAASRRP